MSELLSNSEDPAIISTYTALNFAHLRKITSQKTLPSRLSIHLATTTNSVAFLHLAIHELINNHPKYDNPRPFGRFRTRPAQIMSRPVEWVLSYLQNASCQVLRRLQMCIPSPYSEALYLGLFRKALESGAFRVIHGLLRTSPKPKSLIRSHMVNEYRGDLVYSFFCSGHLELSRLIFEYCDESSTKGMQNSFSAFESGEVSVEPLKLWLQDARVTSGSVARLILSMGDLELTKILLDRVPEPKHETFLDWIVKGSTILQHATRVLCEADANWFLNTVLQEVQHGCPGWLSFSNVVRSPYDASEPVSDALNSAVSRKYASVVQLLLKAGASANPRYLCEAIHVRELGLIITLLDFGVSPFDVVDLVYSRVWGAKVRSSVNGGAFSYTTPYAEAMRVNFSEAIRLFDERISGLSSTKARLTLVVAASEIGDVQSLGRFMQPHEVDDLGENRFQSDTAKAYADALYRAHNCGHKSVVSILLKAGAQSNCTTLSCAIQSRNSDMVHMFLERSNGICSANDIIRALDTGDPLFLYSMLECVNLSNITGCGEILKKAVEQEDTDLIQYLMYNGISPESDLLFNVVLGLGYTLGPDIVSVEADTEFLDTPLTFAIRKGNADITQRLLDATVRVNNYKLDRTHFTISAIEAAASVNNTELIEKLLTMGAEPYDSRALTVLAHLDQMELIKRLLAVGKHRFPKSDGHRLCLALDLALRSNNIELVRLLSDHAELNRTRNVKKDSGMVLKANALGIVLDPKLLLSTELLQILLRAGSDPEAICREWYTSYTRIRMSSENTPHTALLGAVYVQSKPHIDVLIDHGADINRPATNYIKKTPLQLAAGMGYMEIVAHLLGKGADVNGHPAPVQGATALQFASKGGFCPIVELLIHHGAEVNAPAAKINGRTAFEYATEWGRLDVMLLLVRSGADLLSTDGDKQFRRAIRFAEKRDEHPAVQLAKDLQQKAAAATVEFECYERMDFSF